MTKERRTRSCSRVSPYSGACSHHRGSSSSSCSPHDSSVEAAKDMKEWDEVRCPVCMEYPHNAVMLTCSSGGKGCHPFMCDTSYRHSNCLDQYKKTSSESSMLEKSVDGQEQSKLPCPLCRGEVTGWKVVEAARKYMNCKVRSCSTESCGFTGSYGELRKHARKEHPSDRPSEPDPERQRDWRRMEQRRDLGDLFSSMQSALSGEDGGLGAMSGEDDGLVDMIEDEDELSSFPINPVTVYLIFRISSVGGVSRGWTTLRSSGGPAARIISWSRRTRGGNLPAEAQREPQPDDTDVSSDNIDDDDNDEEEGDDDDGADESNLGAAGYRRARGTRQLRMFDEEDEGDRAIESNEGAVPSRQLRRSHRLRMPAARDVHNDDVAGGSSNANDSNVEAAAPSRRGRGRPRRQLRITDDEASGDSFL